MAFRGINKSLQDRCAQQQNKGGIRLHKKIHSRLENEYLTEAIINHICEQLSQRNWSLKMLADRADLPYESVKKLVNGKISRPSFISIWQIANALGCSVDKLAGRSTPADTALAQITESATEIYRILSTLNGISGKER